MTSTKTNKSQGVKADRTMPASFYRSQDLYERSRDEIFARSWQFIGDSDTILSDGTNVVPVNILEGCLDEPCILIRGAEPGALSLHSNVCTHRGSVLVEKPCHVETMRCRYHGRRFGLDGCFVSAPGFEQAENFPTEQDNLAKIPMQSWGKFHFASIEPAFTLDELIGDMKERLHFLPLDQFHYAPELSRDYFINANWALYCDNYLEGLHVPYVHPSLATLLDTRAYRTELLPYGNLQVGVASNEADAFELPQSHPDYGQHIAAYYYWLYPNMMFNFYPWGLSINLVIPQAYNQTKVRFLTYVWRPERFGNYSTADINQTELEDEEVVHAVQRGIQSRVYKSGRYSPTWEAGVHQFHRLIAASLGF
ncbi:MAG: Rieske 2Fe-2S domain-containing protein [Cyanobacteria bacterium SZAS LIN-3]|nr:Rieske 2Fe-2S domain-containing protein [Cyanobacteria bacterium SZAS LIN-3]